MKIFGKVKQLNIYHLIACMISAGFLTLTFLCFLPAFTRIWESIKDLGLSVAYSFQELFNLDNFSYYSLSAWLFVCNVLLILLSTVVPVGLILYLIISKKFLRNENNDYNVNSRPLNIALKFSKNVYLPAKKFVVGFVDFIKERTVYLKIWAVIWIFNFNGFTILLELFAYYFFFATSLNVSRFYVQLYKLCCDLSVVVHFIPLWGWIIIGYVVLCIIRRRIGYKRLNHNEMKNRGFINSLPFAVMGCGTMGSNKTTLLTDIALSQEVMFIDRTLEKMEVHSIRFPYFPWITLENLIKEAVNDHEVYSLATCRRYVAKLQSENYDFGYDVDRYGDEYDDALELRTLWKAIESYAQLYFLYTLKTSFLVFNYSVRTSNVMIDKGNLPMWDTDFFKRQTVDMEEDSKYAHILDFDAFRLGKKMKRHNQNADFFEFGVVGITEFGKERGNMVELLHVKKTDEETNQKNDLFNPWLKLIRHNATIDYDCYARVFSDEQRPDSLNADAREVMEILALHDKSDVKLAMPFFFIEDFLLEFIFSKYFSFYEKYRHNRGDNTLLFHIIKTLTYKLYGYFERVYNTFGYFTVCIDTAQGKDTATHKYYISKKKTYSKRFSTDAYSDILAVKTLQSKVGINDIATYEDIKASYIELAQQNSYFVNELLLGLLRNK